MVRDLVDGHGLRRGRLSLRRQSPICCALQIVKTECRREVRCWFASAPSPKRSLGQLPELTANERASRGVATKRERGRWLLPPRVSRTRVAPPHRNCIVQTQYFSARGAFSAVPPAAQHVEETIRRRDDTSKGRYVEGTIRRRDDTSKGRYVEGTIRRRDDTSKGRRQRRYVEGTIRRRDDTSKGRYVEGTIRRRDDTSKRRYVEGTIRRRDDTSQRRYVAETIRPKG